MQAEMGVPATPLEVPAAEWAPAARSIDFADGTVRGPARSRIEREISRKTRDSSASPDTRAMRTPTSRPRSRPHPGVALGARLATLVTAGAVVVAALYATGVLR